MIACALLLLWATPTADLAPDSALPAHFHFAEERRADGDLRIAAEDPGGPMPHDWRPRMVIDGKLTEIEWPGQPPGVWRIAQGVFLLCDAYATGRIYVWHAAAGTLTDHGRGQLQTISGLGTLMLRQTPEVLSAANSSRTWELLDFNPMTGEPRVAWRQVAGKDAWMVFVGHREGAPVLRQADRIVTLRPGKPPIVRKFKFGNWRPVTSDAIRGAKMLLLGRNKPEVFGYSHNGKLPQFTTEVGLLDLDDGTIRRIGMIPGGWTMHTAVPHPRTSVAWISVEEATRLDGTGDGFHGPLLSALGLGATGYVHEETLKLWPGNKGPKNED